ncbi:MAG: hypothetical protein KDB61_12175, partial [Planctomycetes bacterium]|nr:hypothetical protein [Planctomycetota bacterium]
LAKLRLQAGQAELAREEADGALEVYRSGRADTIDIYRTQALLPLAEVMHALGDPKAADAMYTLALNEALVNPNSRPRAQDLCAILCSMAREGYVAPEAWTQSCQAAIAALSDPW